MDGASPSERVTTFGSYGDLEPVCAGIRVDAKWKHQHVFESKS